ncbi:MAG: sodium:calcium antiporter [Candidatus Dadabacteria bacterium]|nr:MAG: sodium:calcium antiporter [Candidatus Dadabacteria bacterium]
MNLILLVVGFALLIGGADLLVRGASAIARYFGLSPLVIGLTVVAFGTSSPELFVSTVAAYKGSFDVALGNVIGSNIFNIAVIIGVAALITPIKVGAGLVKRDLPIMNSFLIAFYLASLNRTITKVEGGVLFLALCGYLQLMYFVAKKQHLEKVFTSSAEKNELSLLKSIIFTLGGILGLVFGGDLVVDSAVKIARIIGVSQLVISALIVAAGTSLPELATTVVAAFKKQPDLALGNAIGSNIFNVGAVIGVSALVSPIKVSHLALSFDMFYMIGVCLFSWFLMSINLKVGRLKALLLLLTYIYYISASL